MEKDKNKIREPFRPEDTPRPPQNIDPDERSERKKPVRDKPVNERESKSADENQRGPRVGDAPDIDDETTI